MKAMSLPVDTVAVVAWPAHLPRDRKAAEVVTGRVAVQSVQRPIVRQPPPGDFWRVGRDTQHANPHIWMFQGWNDAEILSVQAPNFLFPTIPSAMVIPGSPQPGQRPFTTGVVIQAPNAGSWSAMATIRPPQSASDKYLKLLPR